MQTRAIFQPQLGGSPRVLKVLPIHVKRLLGRNTISLLTYCLKCKTTHNANFSRSCLVSCSISNFMGVESDMEIRFLPFVMEIHVNQDCIVV